MYIMRDLTVQRVILSGAVTHHVLGTEFPELLEFLGDQQMSLPYSCTNFTSYCKKKKQLLVVCVMYMLGEHSYKYFCGQSLKYEP